MKKVTSVNLAGRAFQLEEAGYHKLAAYLDEANDRLAKDPDRTEIIADLERALADKCDQHLSSGKNVVTEHEVLKIIADMGPVAESEGESDDAAPSATKSTSSSLPKRFYLIKEESMVGGVATGMAAYFNADVTVVRLGIVALTFITGGATIPAYIAVMLIAPTAKTPEQKAAARGESFNSRELIQQARRKATEIAAAPAFSQAGNVIRQIMRGISGVVAAAAILAFSALSIAAVSGIVSLATTGSAFGVSLNPALEPIIAIVALLAAYVVVAIPLLYALMAAYQYARHGTAKSTVWGGIAATAAFSLALTILITLFSTSPTLQEELRNATRQPDGSYCLGICAPSEPTPPADPFEAL